MLQFCLVMKNPPEQSGMTMVDGVGCVFINFIWFDYR